MQVVLIFLIVLFAGCSSDPVGSGPQPDMETGQDSGVDLTEDAAIEDARAPDATIDIGEPDASPDADAGLPDVGNGPYGALTDAALMAAIRADVEETKQNLGYNAGRQQMYGFTGVEDNEGRIECVYTGRTVDTDGSNTPDENCRRIDGTPNGCSFNTEHVVPRGRLRDALTDGSADYNAAEGDIHHLFPSTTTSNNARGNYPFGLSNCGQNCFFDEETIVGHNNGSGGSCGGNDPCVTDVRDERRGDMHAQSSTWPLYTK